MRARLGVGSGFSSGGSDSSSSDSSDSGGTESSSGSDSGGGGGYPTVGRGEKDLDSGSAGGNASGGTSDSDPEPAPEPSTPQGPTGTQPDGSQPPSQDTDSNSSGGNQPVVGRGEKDLDSGSAGNESADLNDRDSNTTGGVTRAEKVEGAAGSTDPNSGTAGNTDEAPSPAPSGIGGNTGSGQLDNAPSQIPDRNQNQGNGVIDDVQNFADNTVESINETAFDVADRAQDVGENVHRAGKKATVAWVQGDNLEAADHLAGRTDEWVMNAEVDTGVTDDLTEGGVLSETPDSNEGLLPGSVAGVDLSEKGFQRAADEIDQTKEGFDQNKEWTIAGSDLPDRALTGAAKTGVDFLNVPSHIQMAETGIETGTNAPGEISEEGVAPVAETAAGITTLVGASMAKSAKQNPVEFASGAAFGYVTGAKTSQLLGRATRAARGRVRTLGGEKVDLGGVTQDDVVKNMETDGAEGSNFPGADNPELYRNDPAEAVRQQADDMTPEEIARRFDETGIDNGVVLKKALEREPSGGGRDATGTGKSTGFKTQEGDYESPGGFFGPELSPYFLGEAAESSMSLRPGLPDLGGKPTGVLAKTDVKNTDADSMEGFNKELIENAGDTTARTKPEGEVSTDEIEAVLPPGAKFTRLPDEGLGKKVMRRFGIGADFYTEVGGRRVPLRPVAPSDRSPDADVPDGDAPDGSGTGQSIYEYIREPSQPQDNPIPIPPGIEGGAAASQTGSAGGSDSWQEPTSNPPVDTGDLGPSLPPRDTPSSPSSPPSETPGGTQPIDEFGPTSPPGSGGPTSDPPSSPPSETPGGTPPIDEYGTTPPSSPPSSPPSDPPTSGPSSPPIDEFGPTSPTPSDPPSSGGPSGPSSPPTSGTPSGPGPSSPPPSSPPTSSPPGSGPPESLPPYSPPGSPGGSSGRPSPPRSSGGSSGGAFGPGNEFFRSQDKPRADGTKDRDPEDELAPLFSPFAINYTNPIASGAEALASILGGGGQPSMIDETGGAGGDGGPPLNEGLPESYGTEDMDDWTPF